jgi:hypothetical protein
VLVLLPLAKKKAWPMPGFSLTLTLPPIGFARFVCILPSQAWQIQVAEKFIAALLSDSKANTQQFRAGCGEVEQRI